MNWGKKILLAYLLFVIGIVYMVIKATNQQQDLVTKEYYEQELKYQQKINETLRADSIQNAVTALYATDTLTVLFSDLFSSVSLEGDVLIYCPDDEKKDFKYHFNLSNGATKLNIPYSSKGFRRIKINWKAGEKNYYKELRLNVQ